MAWEPRPQAFIQPDTTTAHQGRLQEHRGPPRPLEVLGPAKGRLSAADERARGCSHARFPRTTTRPGGVTVPRDHVEVEAGFPQTPVRLWGAGEPWRAVCEHVLRAESHGRSDGRARHVNDLREGLRDQTRVASPPGALIPLTPQACLVVSRATRPRRRAPHPARARQLRRFECIATGYGRRHSPPGSRMWWRGLCRSGPSSTNGTRRRPDHRVGGRVRMLYDLSVTKICGTL
jgi:hypothetical protein